jgi:hypothetical protein
VLLHRMHQCVVIGNCRDEEISNTVSTNVVHSCVRSLSFRSVVWRLCAQLSYADAWPVTDAQDVQLAMRSSAIFCP